MQGHTACDCRRMDHQPERLQRASAWRLSGKKLIPIGRVGTGFPQRLLRWLVPRLKQLEADVSPFSAPIPRKAGRTIHWAKPEFVAGFEMTSWTNDGVIRQASLQEVRERSDKKFRPDWINLPSQTRE